MVSLYQFLLKWIVIYSGLISFKLLINLILLTRDVIIMLCLTNYRTIIMIASFADKATAAVYFGKRAKRIAPTIYSRARAKLHLS